MVTSVVSRIGTASTRIGTSSVATVVPATFQLEESPSPASAKPSACEPESPMKTSALPRGRRLNGRNPAQASAPASENASTAWLGCTVAASIAKKTNAMPASDEASPSTLSSRLKAFVIPTGQNILDCPGDDRVVDELFRGPGCEDDRARGDLHRQFGERVQMAYVIDQSGQEHEGDAGIDAEQLLRRMGGANRNREPEPGAEPGEEFRSRRRAASRTRASGRPTDAQRAGSRVASAAAPRSRARKQGRRRAPRWCSRQVSVTERCKGHV